LFAYIGYHGVTRVLKRTQEGSWRFSTSHLLQFRVVTLPLALHAQARFTLVKRIRPEHKNVDLFNAVPYYLYAYSCMCHNCPLRRDLPSSAALILSLSLSLPPSVAANHAYVPSAVMIVFSLDQQCHILPHPPHPSSPQTGVHCIEQVHNNTRGFRCGKQTT
jgi:hypothetical protein